MTISLGISAHTSLIHQRTRFLLGAFFFQAGVNSNGPNVIHAKYFWCTLSLNGLFRHLSKGCTTGVRPPGIIVTSMFRCFRSSFTNWSSELGMSPTPKGNAQHVANSVKSILGCPVHPSTLSYGRKHEEAVAQPDLSVYGRL